MDKEYIDREAALKWLYRQLRRKRIALGKAEDKMNVDRLELESLEEAIEVIEWIIGKVTEVPCGNYDCGAKMAEEHNAEENSI